MDVLGSREEKGGDLWPTAAQSLGKRSRSPTRDMIHFQVQVCREVLHGIETVFCPCSRHEGCDASLSFVINVGVTMIEKIFHEFKISTGGCFVKYRPSIVGPDHLASPKIVQELEDSGRWDWTVKAGPQRCGTTDGPPGCVNTDGRTALCVHGRTLRNTFPN